MKISTCYSRGIVLVLTADTPGGVVRNNVVHTIGGNTTGAADQEVRGIDVEGGSFVVEGNTVGSVAGKGVSSGYCIFCAFNTDTFVVNNRASRADIGIRMNAPNEYRDNFTATAPPPTPPAPTGGITTNPPAIRPMKTPTLRFALAALASSFIPRPSSSPKARSPRPACQCRR